MILDMDEWRDKRVLMVLPMWDPMYRNKNIGQLFSALLENHANVTVFCQEAKNIKDLKQTFPAIKIVTYSNEGFILKLFTFIKIYRYKYDIVLWTYSGYKENFIMAVKKILCGTPYVIKLDSYVAPEKARNIRNLLSKYLFFLFPGIVADLVIAESNEILLKAKSLYKHNRIFKYSVSISVSKFRKIEEQLRNMGYSKKGKVILYTGRIHHEKGIDLLIKSFLLIKDKLSNWKLKIIGPVWDYKYAEECKRLVNKYNLSDRIQFYPALYDIELYKFYFYSDIFALPSRKEGMPNSLPEAMFFENPVVAYNVGQVRSLVNDQNGILVPAEDIDGFANAILNLALNNEYRINLGKNARHLILSKYNSDILIPKLLDKCMEIIKKDI